MIDASHTLELLSGFKSDFEEEIFFRRQTLAFLDAQEAFWQRSTLEGHLTGSAWVLHPDRESVLLIHHRKLDKWFQPGGHAEPEDRLLQETARREAEEECGLKGLTLLSDQVFDLDIHVIPGKRDIPEHLHYDMRFIFQSPTVDFSGDIAEINDLRWVPVRDLAASADIQQSIRRMALKCLRMLGGG